MKKIALTFLVFMGASLFATNAPSLSDPFLPAVKDGANAWIAADLLYWKPRERAIVATNDKSDVFITDDFTKASVSHPHFNWNLGYRLHGGCLFSSHLWDIEASWTHFTSHISQHRSSHGSAFIGMFPIRSLSDDVMAGDYVFESNLKWKLSVNMLEVQFGRYLKAFQRLDFKPFFGLRSASIRQHGDVVYKGGMFLIGILQPGVSLNGTDFIKMENNYWGMGPRIGIDPRFFIGKGFSLNAEVAISSLYGFFNTHQKETYLDAVRFSHHEHLNRFCWIGDLAAGIEWKTFLHQERYAITFKADWEYHIFFHQFELKRDDFGLTPKNRDLSMQGVTFSVLFNF